jgi:hypothetical protein
VESGRYQGEIMAKMYENLDVWKEAIDLAVTIYNVTNNFPKFEQYC